MTIVVLAAASFAWLFPQNVHNEFDSFVEEIESGVGIRGSMTTIRESLNNENTNEAVSGLLATSTTTSRLAEGSVPAIHDNTPIPSISIPEILVAPAPEFESVILEPTSISRASSPTATPLPYVVGLPDRVAEYFYDQVHDRCQTLPRENLRVVESWSGSENGTVEVPRHYGQYYLIVNVEPTSPEWHLSSTYHSGRTTFDSLRLSSDVDEGLFDIQRYCGSATVLSRPGDWVVDVNGLNWALYLVVADHGDLVPKAFDDVLDGYYGAYCPKYPEAQDLHVEAEWHSSDFGDSAHIPFTILNPITFLVAEFEPNSDDWRFDSVNSDGDWESRGPTMSSDSDQTLDLTITCPTQADRHRLDIDSTGGAWSVYQVTAK